MGYKRAKKTYQLNFTAEDMGGLVVRARGISIGELQDIYRDAESHLEATTSEILDRDLIHLAGGEINGRRVRPALLEWNLEDDDGNVMPISVESLREQDRAFTQELYGAWMRAVANIAAPLDKPSPSGEPFQEASIPMETS